MPQVDLNRAAREVIRAIQAGKIDGLIPEILAAIDDRNEVRKKNVEALVKQVFGRDAYVAKEPKRNVFLERSKSRAPNEVLPGESPHVQPVDPFPEDNLSPDDESHSPVFGARPNFS